ncbi:hypothetical protein [Streptomyces zagrosensis]|uniref:Uncharacterized protein n=1 Tax=Streptomyces zagrosensis TaxID=1042984 RepID=A0A7W9Q4X6_9ACTN|nr:hypothetical protein [Streptomyces zagrosensis]MBB5933683.1 hypothetical protein [Streptomyces zagrosensis]
MNIDWAALGQVFGVSLVVTVAMVGVFTLGIVGTSAKPSRSGAGSGTVTAGATGPSALGRSGAYLCFALCAAAVAYGIYLIVA